jgi:hypothetical protein
MATEIVRARDPAVEALAVARTVLRYDKLADLAEILREIGEATGSFAVLLWELAPDVHPNDMSACDQLFVLAGWLKDGGQFASHSLPLYLTSGFLPL